MLQRLPISVVQKKQLIHQEGKENKLFRSYVLCIDKNK